MRIERDVLMNSKYIISYFNERGKLVTHLMLQKLLYFLEAIYMVKTDDTYLYEEDFYAWDFGPVNTSIYSYYKYFGSSPIELDEKININKTNEVYIVLLYELFKDYNAFMLVNLSHAEGSPWRVIYQEYNEDDIPKHIIVDKMDTKKWFRSIITDENTD